MIEYDNEEEVENNANITTLDNNTIIEDGNINDITLQKKETASIIDVVLVFIHPNDIMAKVDEERTVMDFLANS